MVVHLGKKPPPPGRAVDAAVGRGPLNPRLPGGGSCPLEPDKRSGRSVAVG